MTSPMDLLLHKGTNIVGTAESLSDSQHDTDLQRYLIRSRCSHQSEPENSARLFATAVSGDDFTCRHYDNGMCEIILHLQNLL